MYMPADVKIQQNFQCEYIICTYGVQGQKNTPAAGAKTTISYNISYLVSYYKLEKTKQKQNITTSHTDTIQVEIDEFVQTRLYESCVQVQWAPGVKIRQFGLQA